MRWSGGLVAIKTGPFRLRKDSVPPLYSYGLASFTALTLSSRLPHWICPGDLKDPEWYCGGPCKEEDSTYRSHGFHNLLPWCRRLVCNNVSRHTVSYQRPRMALFDMKALTKYLYIHKAGPCSSYWISQPYLYMRI